jgi:PTS system cellobiose-specific IIC component
MIVTSVDPAFFGPAGSFIGIVIGIASVELYMWISKFKSLEIRMPQGVPPAVGKSFKKLLPIIITLLIIAGIDTFVF